MTINCKMKHDYLENNLKLTEFLCDIGHLGRTLKRNCWAGCRAGDIRTIIYKTGEHKVLRFIS